MSTSSRLLGLVKKLKSANSSSRSGRPSGSTDWASIARDGLGRLSEKDRTTASRHQPSDGSSRPPAAGQGVAAED